MPTTARMALRYPAGTEPANVPLDMQELAEDVAARATMFVRDTLANRPAAGVVGRIYEVTGDATASNNGRLFWDTGGSWIEVARVSTTEPAGAVAAHEGATNPHPVYLTGAEGDGVYTRQVNGSLRGYREPRFVLPTSGTVTLDFAAYNVWRIDPSAAVTIAWANLPAPEVAASGTLIVGNSNHAITWPSGTEFPGGSAPELNGKTVLSILAERSTVAVGTAWTGVT